MLAGRAKLLRSGLRASAIGPRKHREMVRWLKENSQSVHNQDLLLTAKLTKASVVSVNLGRETWTTKIKIRVPPIQA